MTAICYKTTMQAALIFKHLHKHSILSGILFLLTALYCTDLLAQREFRVLQSLEYDATEALPDDYQVPGEFVVGRLMYPSGAQDYGWERGGTSWAVDYPRGDRTYARLLERLTTIDVRSVEQPVNLDDGDDIYNWPFLIVGMPRNWSLTDGQAAKLRDYLLRGGFLLADSFFGSREWSGFMRSLNRVFPDRQIVDLPDDHQVFSIIYDLSGRTQVANMRQLSSRGVPYRGDGAVPQWRAILDDAGRVMVAISFNNDMGDAWQHQDNPRYPQSAAKMGIEFGVNYAIYSITH
tara:strand:- start:13835 stop:14707 length:873 start_codon:yes stop_codon:yes gene_type:complete